MAFLFGRLRHIAAGAIGAGSIVAGLILAFRLVTPGLVEHLPTSELLGLLGLLVLPLLMLWVILCHRRAAASLPVAQPAPRASSLLGLARTSAQPENAPAPGFGDDAEEPGDSEIEVHAPGRRAVRHRRHDHARANA